MLHNCKRFTTTRKPCWKLTSKSSINYQRSKTSVAASKLRKQQLDALEQSVERGQQAVSRMHGAEYVDVLLAQRELQEARMRYDRHQTRATYRSGLRLPGTRRRRLLSKPTCVAACHNAAAMLCTVTKVSHLGSRLSKIDALRADRSLRQNGVSVVNGWVLRGSH